MHGDLWGRVIVVTGASRGIGRAATLALAARGATVIGTARSPDGLADLPDAALAAGGRFVPFTAEMADATRLHELADYVGTSHGRLDGLFGNAGILGVRAPLGRLHAADFREALDVNLVANSHLIREFDALLRAAPAGRALFVTSGVAHKRHAGWAGYAVTKAALEALAGTWANELAGTGVCVNCLSPGPIRTELRAEAWPAEDPAGVPPPEALAPVIADLLSPATTETGAIYDFPTRRFTRTKAPD